LSYTEKRELGGLFVKNRRIFSGEIDLR